jgi:hypothetical protein
MNNELANPKAAPMRREMIPSRKKPPVMAKGVPAVI